MNAIDPVFRRLASTARTVEDGKPSSIPVAAMQRAGLVDWRANNSPLADEYRVLQAGIRRTLLRCAASSGRAGGSVLVTSAVAAEGKTYCALNLAAALAATGAQPVILMDLDTTGRSPNLTDVLGIRTNPGLADLDDDCWPGAPEMVLETEIQGLSIMPAGQPNASRNEFLGETAVAAMEHLRSVFPDYFFVLDGPACLTSSLPNLVAASAAHVLMVVRARHTRRAQVVAALDLIGHCPSVSIVLSKTRSLAGALV